MWFPKHVLTILLLSSHLLPVTATSDPGKVTGDENLDKDDSFPHLGPDEIHTTAVSEEFFETYKPTIVEEHQEPPPATELGHMFSSRSASPKHPMYDAKNFTFMSDCLAGTDWINFTMSAFFDGNRVHFKGEENVDGYGEITMSRGHGNTLISNAHFYHSVCRTISPTFVCEYQYFGTAKATVIPSGTTKHLSLGAYYENANEKKLRPVVQEACMHHKKEQGINCANLWKYKPKMIPCEFHGVIVG